MQVERITSRGQVFPLTFMQDAVAASQTDVQLPIAEVTAGAGIANTEYRMPWAGEIVAITYALTAAGTTGAFTIGPTIGGTEQTGLTVTVGTTTSGQAIVKRGSVPFVAGALIGAEITTAAGWDGTTADLVVQVWVRVDLDGI